MSKHGSDMTTSSVHVCYGLHKWLLLFTSAKCQNGWLLDPTTCNCRGLVNKSILMNSSFFFCVRIWNSHLLSQTR